MGSIISAIGTAAPVNRFSQEEILKFMVRAHQLNPTDSQRLEKLYNLSGIDYRHSVIPDFGSSKGDYNFFGNGENLEPFPKTQERSALYESTAKHLAAEAIKNIKYGGNSLPAITHLITVSCTGMYAPGLDIDIIELLGLNKSIERTCINFMGCYGAFNALKTADYICRADQTAKVLVVDIELCTLHFQRESCLENWVANSLFADGAAAVLIESELHRSTQTGFRLKTFFNTLVTEAKDEMAWRIGDTGFQMHLSSHIAKNIGKKIKEVTASLIEKSGLSRASISHLAIHPGGRRILEVCEDMLELPEEALQHSYDVLKQYGNMSSATILFVLQKLLSETQPGDNIMSFAFGPGLTFESMILETI
ncbi:type III polyketide synthase [Paradesertivirga mongoliensis]|uniref:Type III polyketide synthase n=1 Tax=Paradesertivirga mongoliensis TaxID=2100740 RepID=A0ABW4ZIW9_9SPHI|nr:type III polyketide synthase [Pedobacter mongoliensis]